MADWLTNLRRPSGAPRIEPVCNWAEFHDVPSSDKVKMLQIFGDANTSAGAVVNATTAMRVSAVFRCVNLIAGAIASLPLPIYQRTETGRERAEHPYWWLLNEQPTARFSAAAFWEFTVAQMLLRGDGLAYIVRDRAGRALGLIPLQRTQVLIERAGSRLRYLVNDVDEDGKTKYFGADQDDMLHFPGCGFDGVSSMSVIGWAARQSIGIAIKADEFAGTFFGSGAHIQYAVKAPGTMTEEQQKLFREAWVAKYGSGQGVSKVPLILTEGLDVKELSMTAEDAQLLESRRFQVEDIARAFGVPPFMLGANEKSTSWGTGIEQLGKGFVTYTLRPHLTRIEQELNRKFWPTRERYFAEFNVDGLMDGDSKTQADYFTKALGGPGAQGWMTINEVRRLKNLPPIAGGDKVFDPTAGKPAKPKETTDESDDAEARAAAA